MGGGKKVASTAPARLNGIQVQSAITGRAIPKGWGTHRVSANLGWYGAFTAIPQNTKQSGGKGGGAKSTTTGYSYTASLVMLLESGPISGIRSVYRDQSVFVDGNGQTALQQAGLSLATGALGQAPWSYLTTNFPDQAIGYSKLAYVYAANYDLSSSATVPNHSFEVVTNTRNFGSDDANFADILPDFLSAVPFWPANAIDDLSDIRAYTDSVGLLLSPVLDAARQASDFLTEMLQAINSDCYCSEGLLKIKTYGDTAVGSWVPNLTPVIDLTDDWFIPPSDGGDPVQVERTRGAGAYNFVQVEFLDRTANYASNIAIGFDQANADQFGRLQNPSPYSLHAICLPSAAQTAAQLIVQRTANVRAAYAFDLAEGFADLLEPMDLVTVTTGDLQQVLVRLTEVTERPPSPGDGRLTEIEFHAEQMLVGTGHAASVAGTTGGGFKPDFDISPGGVADVALINPNRALTGGDYELWIGAVGASASWGGAQIWTSTDGVNYGYTGVDVIAPARIGLAVSQLPVAQDPDTTHDLRVNLSASEGVLLSGSQADADNAVTLALLDDELISYETATLTSSFHYTLTYLRRGLFGSTIAQHTEGATFVRLDSAIAQVPYQAQQVGSVMHVKLLSFNVFRRALQDLSEAVDHRVILTPGAPPVIDIVATDTQNVGGVPASQITNDLIAAIESIEALSEQTLSNALAILANVNAHTQIKAYVDDIVWIGDTPIKTAHLNEVTAREDGDTAIVETIDLIGAKSLDGAAFVINTSTVKVSPTESFADYQTSVTADLASNTAAISTEATTRSTQNAATATLISLIGAQNVGGTAFILNSSTAYVDPSTSLATYTSGVSTTLGTHTSQITSLFTSTAGLSSQWVLSLDSNGHIAGIVLANGSTSSSFTIVADEFIFSDSAGSVQTPFYISGGTVYADNLVVQKLRANIIITNHIQDGQVTQLANTTWGLAAGPGTLVQTLVASASITLTDTANTLAHGSWVMGQDGSHLTWGFQVYLDGAAATSWLLFNLSQGVVSFDLPFDGLAAGTHQVDLYISGATQTVFEIGTLSFQASMR